MINKIKNVIDRYEELASLLIDPNAMTDMKRYAKIAKEHKALEIVVTKGKKYISLIHLVNKN